MGLGAFVARIGRLSFGDHRVMLDLIRGVLRHPLFDLSLAIVDGARILVAKGLRVGHESLAVPPVQRSRLHAEYAGGGMPVYQIRVGWYGPMSGSSWLHDIPRLWRYRARDLLSSII
jgi:hypothetical protein